MNFQYTNGLWKNDTTNVVVPSNSRPFANNSNLLPTGRTPFKPNPIKHWRKQLKPYYKTHSKQVSISTIDAPTSAVHIGSQSADCAQNYALLKENIAIMNECYGIRVGNEGKCVGGSNHITRRANTKISKNYHQNYSKYLKSRCKTYDQNFTLGKKEDETSYLSTQCFPNKNNCSKKVIYKPNNSAFSQQGAVSASSNTLRKKNKEITRNGATYLTAFGNGTVSRISGFDPRDPYAISYVKGIPSGKLNDTQCRQTFKNCN